VTQARTIASRFVTFALGTIALFAGQMAALAALTAWYGRSIGQLPDFTGDGAAITLVIAASTPVQILLVVLFVRRQGENPAQYLGLIWPRRGELVFGVVSLVALVAVANLISWLLGHSLVTPFQSNIYRTALGTAWLLPLWLAIVVITPMGEEILFRGFLFRGWLQSPNDAWPVIVLTSGLWAIIHLQYDWFVIAQVFAFGLLLGWMRWATGSTILAILLHALINLEGMIETVIAVHWLR
jgi:membrane protease YdiL (CAAX protease family)